MKNSYVKRITKADFHRNGVGGQGFTVSLFDPADTYISHKGEVTPSDMSVHEGPFLAIQFGDEEGKPSMYTAILALDDLFKWAQMSEEEYNALPSYNSGLPAWRGDNFAEEIQELVEAKLQERREKYYGDKIGAAGAKAQ